MQAVELKMIDSNHSSFRGRLYLQTAIIGIFLITMIFISIWTGNTLTSITAIARFERTHTVSRLAAKVSLLEYLDTRKLQDKELFYKNMSITQSYNKVFSSLLTMRRNLSKNEFVQILDDTFQEADIQTSKIIVNRIKILYWHPFIKELVEYANKANPVGEKILNLANLLIVEDNKDKQNALLQKIRDAEVEFASYERSFSKRCSDLANQISTFVDYFSIVILILSVGFTGLITYLLASMFVKQAVNHSRDLEKSQERLDLVIKGSNDAPWDWDLITNELYYSPQWWAQLGYGTDELSPDAALWERLMHPEDADHVDSVFRGALDTGIDSYEVEFRLQHKEG
jgi:PAS domain S-box-containing protein